MNNNGKIKLILGPMYSGKTSELLNRYRRWNLAKKKVLMIKYESDNRYKENEIVTHDGLSLKAFKCNLLEELDHKINNYDIICVDEVQFYKDADIYCDKWANQGKIIEASGLNGNYKRQPFEVISKLVALADDITHLKAVCTSTGNDASFSIRTVENDEEILIGSKDMYIAGDRSTWNKYNNKN